MSDHKPETSWEIFNADGEVIARGQAESLLTCTKDGTTSFRPDGLPLTAKDAWDLWLRAGAELVERLPPGLRQATMRNVLAQADAATKADLHMRQRRVPTVDTVLEAVGETLGDEQRREVEQAVHEWSRGV
jgi:hypothetical protein